MAKAKDIFATILEGGLPALLDGNRNGSGTGETRPENTPPKPTPQDIEPSLHNMLMNVSQNQILITTAAVLGVLGIVYLIRK